MPKYITFNTDQADLAKAASGAITYDITHPCIAYIPDWQAAGLVGAIDTKKFTAWSKVNKQLAAPGIVDGKVYGVPWDWGYSAPMYRTDKYTPKEQSWESVLFDKKLRGKVTMYDEGVAMIKIGALINGHENVNTLSQTQINQARDTMVKAKANIVSFWQSETQAMQDFASGKVYVTYAWPDTYAQVLAMKPLKGVKVVYMQPKEGALAWICSFAISANPKNEALAYDYLNTAYSSPAMDYLVNAFYTGGSAMTPAILAKTDPEVRQAVPPRLAQHGAQAAQGVARASPGKPQRLPEGLSAGQVGLIDGTRGGRRVRPPRALAVAATASAPAAAPAPHRRRRRRTSYSTWLLLLAGAGGADRVLPRAALLRLPLLDRPALPGRHQGRRARSTASSRAFSWDRWRELLGTEVSVRVLGASLSMPLWLLGVLAVALLVGVLRGSRLPRHGTPVVDRLRSCCSSCRSSRCRPATPWRASPRSPPTTPRSRSSSARSRPR